MTQVTVDGVMQGNGGTTDEDRRHGFDRGGWAMGMGDDETMTFINQTYGRADAFLFGRRTYELFAGFWGAEERARAAAEDPDGNQIAAALNTRPKYLASTTVTEPSWANTTVLTGDLAAAIGELKAERAGELQVHGSGALVRWLLEHDLVDEITLLIVPVVLGQGTRLFPDAGPDRPARPRRLASRLEGRHDPGLPAQPGPHDADRSTPNGRGDHEMVPEPQEMIRDAVPGFRDPRLDRARHHRPRWRPSTCSTTGSRPTGTGSSPPASGRRTRRPSSTIGAGEAVLTDGPFVESKEYLAGFWVMEAPDLDVALRLAAEGSKACNRKVEVRPFLIG